MKYIAAGMLVFSLSGCASVLSPAGLPATPGEKATAYGYVPLDPLPVDQVNDADSCNAGFEFPGGLPAGSRLVPAPLLQALPDLAVRFAVAALDAEGSLAFGPTKTTAKGKSYRAVLDYINADGVPVDFYIRQRIAFKAANGFLGEAKHWPISQTVPEGYTRVGYDAQISPAFLQQSSRFSNKAAFSALSPLALQSRIEALEKDSYLQVTIPVYVGVGLRLSADIRANEANIDLSGLGFIGAQAEAKRLSGTLTVQTLGVNGKSIAVALPLPSKLDQTTIENAILSIGSTRAMLYSKDKDSELEATPRVVGLYSPIGSDPALINAIYSELSRVRPSWRRRCILQ